MLRQIPIDALGRVDLVEQAVLDIPVSYFIDKMGIAFESDCDDLDWYKGAFFMLEEGIPFALIHYRGNPENHTSLYLDRGLRGPDLRRALAAILNDFGLSPNALTWMHEGDGV
jgi:hypothetical protein